MTNGAPNKPHAANIKMLISSSPTLIKENSYMIFCIYLLILSPIITTIITEYTNHSVNRLCSMATNCVETSYDTIDFFVYTNEAISFLFSIFSSICGILVLLKKKSLYIVIYTYFLTYSLFIFGDYVVIMTRTVPACYALACVYAPPQSSDRRHVQALRPRMRRVQPHWNTRLSRPGSFGPSLGK